MKIALALLLISGPAFAGDISERCVSKDGSVTIVDGNFFEGGKSITFPSLLVFDRHLVARDHQRCTLEKSGKDVLAAERRVYKQHIVYSTDDTKQADLTCETLRSDVPTSDSCAAE
ncbi:MAG: hypothetical protein EOP11_15855 [Proteobacteria bacterium]|nr:MAG: hypothetical protein EOP11_15855 [Pseudomonadota bacterium]